MVSIKDTLDCVVMLHKTGCDVEIYENPTREKMHEILTHLEFCNKSGIGIESFKIEKNVKLI